MDSKIKKLVVFSHKQIWKSTNSKLGFATDGGFVYHMKAISSLFEQTTLVLPLSRIQKQQGEIGFEGNNITIIPIDDISGSGIKRKLKYPFWLLKNYGIIRREIKKADAVHVPIPSDLGTIGMVMANKMGKPLFVRYCGNWLQIITKTEKFWHGFMEKNAGGKNAFLTTGVESEPPSMVNPNIKWIFSSSVTNSEILDLRKNVPSLDLINPKLVIVCRQEEEKGTRQVIEAVKLLKAEHPNLHLHIVGDGGALSSFKQTVNDLSLENMVTFHGKVNHDDVLTIMQQCHLFCYPTRSSEGFPKVVLEAMASGLPVLGTPVSAIKFMLNTGGGIVLSDSKSETLAKAINIAISDTETYLNMQEKALEKSQKFSLEYWASEIKKHLDIYWN